MCRQNNAYENCRQKKAETEKRQSSQEAFLPQDPISLCAAGVIGNKPFCLVENGIFVIWGGDDIGAKYEIRALESAFIFGLYYDHLLFYSSYHRRYLSFFVCWIILFDIKDLSKPIRADFEIKNKTINNLPLDKKTKFKYNIQCSTVGISFLQNGGKYGVKRCLLTNKVKN